MTSQAAGRSRGLSRLQTGLLGLLVVVLLVSVGLRAYLRYERGRVDPSPSQNLVQSPEGSLERELPAPVVRSLPYVTEGSFFALIGFALGYASRKFVKVGLILAAFFVLGLQALVWTGTVSIDWGGLVGKLDALLFNLEQNESMQAFWTHRIPSAGAMLLGYLVGFQRG